MALNSEVSPVKAGLEIGDTVTAKDGSWRVGKIKAFHQVGKTVMVDVKWNTTGASSRLSLDNIKKI